MKPVRFVPQARRELHAAARWYNSRAPGLRADLVSRVDAVLERIVQAPQEFPIWRSGPYRKARLERFKAYNVFFRERETDIVVVALAHGRRKPGYWARRAMP